MMNYRVPISMKISPPKKPKTPSINDYWETKLRKGYQIRMLPNRERAPQRRINPKRTHPLRFLPREGKKARPNPASMRGNAPASVMRRRGGGIPLYNNHQGSRRSPKPPAR
jgi:hypothetical protein